MKLLPEEVEREIREIDAFEHAKNRQGKRIYPRFAELFDMMHRLLLLRLVLPAGTTRKTLRRVYLLADRIKPPRKRRARR